MANSHDHHDHEHDHSHDHGHDHDHDHDPAIRPIASEPMVHADDLDPANRSLADAMRVAFGILKLIMIVMIVAFAASGVFEVKEGHVGVRVHFGAIQGELGKQVLRPGWHFAWPRPIDSVLIVPTKPRDLAIDKAFWFNERPDELAKPIHQKTPQSQLAPGTDGSLLTGDRNLVHGKWSVSYQIAPAVQSGALVDDQAVLAFLHNVSADPDPARMLEAADRLVRTAAERGIVHLVAEVTADSFITGLDDVTKARGRHYMQEYLDDVEAGITITQVTLGEPTAPLAVRDAFDEVTNNQQERARLIDEAKQKRIEALNGAAGPAYPALLLAIDVYEAARRTDGAERIARAEAAIDALLDGDKARDALEPIADDPAVDPALLREAMSDAVVGGQIREIIEQAAGYKSSRAQQVKGEAEKFLKALDEYRSNPQIVVSQLWESTRAAILASPDVETFYLPDSRDKALEVIINRDPKIQSQRESDRYRREINPGG